MKKREYYHLYLLLLLLFQVALLIIRLSDISLSPLYLLQIKTIVTDKKSPQPH